MLVTISGLPGSGTSSCAKQVAAALDLDHLDGGQVFRAMAAERGLELAAFGAVAESDPAIDVEIDRRLADRGAAGVVVLESRLAGWIATNEALDGLKVWLACDDDVRARRVSGRDGGDVASARAENAAREASEATRYRGYYGIDIGDLAIYDLVIDTTTAPVDEVVDRIVAAARCRGGSRSEASER